MIQPLMVRNFTSSNLVPKDLNLLSQTNKSFHSTTTSPPPVKLEVTHQKLDPSTLTPHAELYKPKLILDCKNKIGETNLWNQTDNSLYWVDIDSNLIYILSIETGELKTITFPL